MTVRIRPRDFVKDFLNRDPEIEVLSDLFASLEGPCTLAVDAPWGYGKTTFIKLLHQHLQNKGYRTIQFNAWENDFSDKPFVSLLTELSKEINKILDKKTELPAKFKNIIKVDIDNLHSIAGILISTMYFSQPELVGAISCLQLLPFIKRNKKYNDTSEEYKQYISRKNSFKKALEKVSNDIYENNELPLVIIIDELDRCRPSYAIQFLETLKDFFSVDHIILVLAINSSELAHSIKAVYGQHFNAQEYLHRFFDIDFRLSNQDREKLIDNALQTEKITKYFNEHEVSEIDWTGVKFKHVSNILKEFFGAPDLSLRQISHSIHRLGFVFASLREDQRSFTMTVIVALVFRTFEPEFYHKFYQGHISDADAIDVISIHPVTQTIQSKPEWYIFVAVLILSYCEIADIKDPSQSPLMMKYDKDNPIRKRVNELFNKAKSREFEIKEFIGFRLSVDRIEMFHKN